MEVEGTCDKVLAGSIAKHIMEVGGTCDKVLAGSIAKQQEGQQVHSSPSKPITVYSRIAQPLPPFPRSMHTCRSCLQ